MVRDVFPRLPLNTPAFDCPASWMTAYALPKCLIKKWRKSVMILHPRKRTLMEEWQCQENVMPALAPTEQPQLKFIRSSQLMISIAFSKNFSRWCLK
ncbi:hypothetical protein V5799_006346 [Amblyomma americanum]|uniref:Uncharacterized protein n=1 Tax=Amblyomma americanum TaxID=6943 RepID=A0AAQ4DWN2_AMBAM